MISFGADRRQTHKNNLSYPKARLPVLPRADLFGPPSFSWIFSFSVGKIKDAKPNRIAVNQASSTSHKK
jgi:hypothetical protein